MQVMRAEDAPAVVTFATGALGPVIAKLAELLGGKYKLRRRTRRDINFIKSKFKYMHSLFWNIWESEDFDAPSKDLKKEALDLADDMDDAIDDFILSTERSRSHRCYIQTKTKASPFEDFKRRVNEVWGLCRIKWKTKTAQPLCSLFPRKDTISNPSKPTCRAPFIRKNASEVGCMDGAMDELISYLVGAENTIMLPQLRMAAIVGMEGMGKTTLANLVYEAIGNQFQSRAFVSVTPSPNIKDILTSILEQLAADSTVPFPSTQKATEEEHLIDKISNFLKNRRYLVVIDDLWHCREWETIRKCFPENNLTSRIVTTTRINSIADKWRVDFQALIYHINTCWNSSTQQWSYGIGFEEFDYQLGKVLKPDMAVEGFDWNHNVVCMCAYMPLALVCMFSAVAMVLEEQAKQGLSRKTSDVQDIIEKQIIQNGIQNTPGFEPLVESLHLGYNDLPHHMLKTCLLYCSIYPGGFDIQGDDLVRHWIAEKIVDTEEAGNKNLDELVSRGLIQPVNYTDDEILAYILHPMMRSFLKCKLREDNFISCCSDISFSFARQTHRLCIDNYHYQDDDAAVEGMDPLFGLDWSRVRSLVVFDGAERVPLDKLERLRVLDLQQKLDLMDHHLKDICGLLHLRHLLGLCGIKIGEIPPEIARLQYLEILDVWGNGITELPREIGDLQNLKTLRIRGTKITKLPIEIIMRLKKLKTLDISYSKETIELPKEIGNVQHLENLYLNDTGITWLPSEIGNLENLETLDLSYTKVTKIPRAIGGLKKLKILKTTNIIGAVPWAAGQHSIVGLPDFVRQAWKKSELVAELAGEILNFQESNSGDGGLIVSTKHMHIPQWIKEHFNNIGELDIRICKLEEEDLRILREMPNLEELSLRFEVVPRTPISISSDGFARLDKLTVDSGVPRLTFQEGAMPNLYTLMFEFKLYGGPPIRDPMGINHLTRLLWVSFQCNEWYRAQDRSCISATIDVVRKEAREYRKKLYLFVTGREREEFPVSDITHSSQDSNEAWSSGTSEINELSGIGTVEMDELSSIGTVAMDELSSIGTTEMDELSSIGTTEMDELSSIGTTEMDEEILHKFGHLVEH